MSLSIEEKVTFEQQFEGRWFWRNRHDLWEPVWVQTCSKLIVAFF